MHPELLVPAPLTAEAWAPFGDLIEAGVGGDANQGTAQRRDHLAALVNARGPGAPLNVAAFRCLPRQGWPMPLRLLERHPSSTQVFVPMNARRYLLVVALGGDRPDLSTLRAFVASGRQAVSYHPATWHHPMIALDAVTDFVCLVHEDGTSGDTVEVALDPGEAPAIGLP